MVLPVKPAGVNSKKPFHALKRGLPKEFPRPDESGFASNNRNAPASRSSRRLRRECKHWGAGRGDTCLAELLPLPSPSTRTWAYSAWSNVEWCRSRQDYFNYVALARASFLQRKISDHRPKVVIFYGSTLYKVWGMIARCAWHQAIPGKLMGAERDGTTYFVARHPTSESDKYFREIGVFLMKNYRAAMSGYE